MLSFSVIICTYNPDPVIFGKCLEAIGRAALLSPPAEILIIDNNSSVALKEVDYIDHFVQKHTNTRVIRELNQGLTNARLRGIKESKGQLLVFIDDDNIVSEDFFEAAVGVATRHPFIGAFSGQVILEYDQEPPIWTRRYWGMLVHRELRQDYWSNILFNDDSMPCGAGLCVTRDVADHYFNLHQNGKRDFHLDRSKGSFLSGGDNDLAMCACDIGKGMGLFRDLRLKHHIPANRFTLNYLSKLAHGIYYSTVVLQYFRTGNVDEEGFKARIKHLIRQSLRNRRDQVIQQACRRGILDAKAMLRNNYMKKQTEI